MTREEAKDLSNVLKAYSEGKIIQYQQNGIHRHADLRFYDCPDQDNISFNVKEYNYRIKPEPTYRPFQNVEECWEEMKKHEPFGWLTNDSGTYFMMDFVGDTDISIPNAAIIGFDKALNLGQKFADGTPFGVKEEN